MFLFKKIIDRSTLRQGFQIPVEYHPLLELMPKGMPKHGETRNIKIVLEGQEYDAQLKNQGFNRAKYADHSDVVQIRYNENSPISKRLRQIFSVSWDYVEHIKSLPENIGRKFTIKVLASIQEYLIVNTTDIDDVFFIECITTRQKQDAHEEMKVQKLDEFDFETSFEAREDTTAKIKEVTGIRRIRMLDRSIGESLKHLYDYRCQMTGEKIGEKYDAKVVEAHHIIPFTKSMNNDTSNIIILSPTYHRIIHNTNPKWDNKKLAFIFPNGLEEKVKLNKHLGI